MKSEARVGIQVGVSVGAVEAVANAIMRILQVDADQVTIQKALDVLPHGTQVHNTAITNCHIIQSA